MQASSTLWSDSYLVGFDSMDDTHREFVDQIRALEFAEGASIAAALLAMEAHCESHFAHEEGLMLDSAYPSADCHAQEHAAVLASLREVIGWWRPGADIATIRRLADALGQWFKTHTTYLDSALGQWLAKRQFGGVPLVLRRNVAVGGATVGLQAYAD